MGSQLLPDGRILFWDSGNTLCLQDRHSKRHLADYSMKNVFAAEPVVWRAYLTVERQTADAGLDSFSAHTILGGVGIKPIYWHGAYECAAHHLFEDGRAIITQTNGQVCFLWTYIGNRRASIKELSEETLTDG